MRKSQQHTLDIVTNFLASHGEAATVVGSLGVAAVVFCVGWVYRNSLSIWVATSARVGGLLLGVIVLALQASHGGWLAEVDQSVTAWLVANRQPAIDHVALVVSSVLGPAEIALVATGAAVAVGIKSRSAIFGLIVLVAVGSASTVCWLTKLLVARGRPPLAVQETLEADYSFPSGHVTGTAALVAILAVAAGLAASRTVKALLSVGAVIVVSAVALSQLYLGVHWLTDVVAGVLLAAAAVTVCAAALVVLIDDPVPTAVKPHLLRPSRKALS